MKIPEGKISPENLFSLKTPNKKGKKRIKDNERVSIKLFLTQVENFTNIVKCFLIQSNPHASIAKRKEPIISNIIPVMDREEELNILNFNQLFTHPFIINNNFYGINS